jgi:hypothetical protein
MLQQVVYTYVYLYIYLLLARDFKRLIVDKLFRKKCTGGIK